jgi:hypothetical protein
MAESTVTTYYGGQDYLAANPGSTAEIQDPKTGIWYPYVPGDANDNGRGNMRVTPAAGGGGAGSTFDPVQFQQVVGRPPTADETAYYSQAGPGWLDEVKANTPGGGVIDKVGGDVPSNPSPIQPPEGQTPVSPAPAPPPTTYTPPAPPPNTYAPPTAGYGAAPAAPPAAGAGGAVGGAGGGLIQEYPGGPFVPPEQAKGPAWVAPTWNAPTYTAPTYQSAMDDPGYQFAQEEGQKGVERSAAARGVLNSGGTLQDIAKWNQALASTQYANVADRALQGFQTNTQNAFNAFTTNAANDKAAYDANYKTQYEDPYRNAYQSAWDKWSAGYNQWKDRINISKDITTL